MELLEYSSSVGNNDFDVIAEGVITIKIIKRKLICKAFNLNLELRFNGII